MLGEDMGRLGVTHTVDIQCQRCSTDISSSSAAGDDFRLVGTLVTSELVKKKIGTYFVVVGHWEKLGDFELTDSDPFEYIGS